MNKTSLFSTKWHKSLLMVCGAFILFSLSFSSCKSKQKVVEITGARIEAKNPSTDTEAKPATQPKKTTIQEEEPVDKITRNEKFSLVDADENVTTFNYTYHVVVGSFALKENGKNLQQKLNKEGNAAFVVVNEKGMFRVVIASYNEYEQAKNRISQISDRFADAWVLVQK